jgi:hypothetical protein
MPFYSSAGGPPLGGYRATAPKKRFEFIIQTRTGGEYHIMKLFGSLAGALVDAEKITNRGAYVKLLVGEAYLPGREIILVAVKEKEDE